MYARIKACDPPMCVWGGGGGCVHVCMCVWARSRKPQCEHVCVCVRL